MKFTKPLHVFAKLGLITVILMGCASQNEKSDSSSINTRAGKSGSSNSSSADKAEPASLNHSAALSALPSGPASPNPYYQVVAKVPDVVQIQFQAAIAAMEQKNWNTAEAGLKSITATNPNLSGAWLNLGIVYRQKSDLKNAREALLQAIRVNSLNVDAYSVLALVEREQGDFNAAQSHLEKSLVVWPFYADGHKNLAILFDLYVNQPEKALPHYLAYQQLLKDRNLSAEAKQAETKQIDSWVAEVQRRLNGGKKPEAANPQPETTAKPEVSAQ